MSNNYHHVQLKIESGELHRDFVCTAPGDAACRRRAKDILVETWTDEEETTTGHDCWAREWVEAVGIEEALVGSEDGVLASVPVDISYDEGVRITPVKADETAEVR